MTQMHKGRFTSFKEYKRFIDDFNKKLNKTKITVMQETQKTSTKVTKMAAMLEN